MTAGVEGSQGFVYGSPSYYKQGMMTQLCSTLFGPSDSELGSFVKGIFIDEEIQQIAAKNQRDLAITDFDDANSRSEKTICWVHEGYYKKLNRIFLPIIVLCSLLNSLLLKKLKQ